MNTKQFRKKLNEHTNKQIEKISDVGIKEIYLKIKLWERASKGLRKHFEKYGINFLERHETESLIKSLKKSGFDWYLKDNYLKKEVKGLSAEEYRDIGAEKLFSKYTNQSISESERVKRAREKIKFLLNNSTGMPIDRIVSKLVNMYSKT